MADPKEEAIREELRTRVNQRFFGHLPENTREVKVVQIYLVVAGDVGCPGCDQAIEAYKKEIEAGDVVVVSQNDDKGMDIILTLAEYALPALVAEDEEGDYTIVEQAS